MSELRPYQRDLIARAQAAYRDGLRSVLVQCPTGGGKTYLCARGVIAPSVAMGRRVVFVADLEEIVEDTADRLRSLSLPVGVVKAGRPSDPTAPVQVCSLQTLARRLGDLPPADRVILDEAHIAGARTVRELLTHYRGGLVWGTTATPARGDGQPLDEFERLIVGPSMRTLIADGSLVQPTVFAPHGVLERGVARDPVEVILENVERRFAVFAPDAAQADRIAREATEGGHLTVAVLDGMGRDERRSVRGRLESGEVRSLVTVRALQKGFDAPLIDAVILTQTGSITSFLQSVGRGLRTHLESGKRECLVWDLRGAVHVHGLPEDDRAWSLEGAQGKSAAERPQGLRRCADCHAMFPPVTRCPRCGSVHVTDPRPLRVQRAEMFDASAIPLDERSRLYREGIERKLLRSGKPAHVAARIAARAVPPWERKSAEVAS